MIEIAGFAFLRLSWILVLPLVAVLGFAFARRASALSGWDRAADPALLAALQRLGRVVPGSGGKIWLPPAAAAVVISLALVGPAREARDGESFRNLDGLVIAIDLSRSIAEGGGLAPALTAARLVADRAGSRPVALVVYGGDAYLASTFTTDAVALGTTIAVLDGATVPDAGSRPERALALARRALADADILSGDVVLVTDGGGLGAAALGEADAIATAGSRISTLFVAATAGPEGTNSPERAAVDSLARRGGGLAGDALDPLDVAEAVGSRPATRLVRSEFAVLFWTDYGRYLLVLALFPALAMFRRRA